MNSEYEDNTKEIFDIVHSSYMEVNHDYLQKQIDLCSKYLTEELKEEIRKKDSGFII